MKEKLKKDYVVPKVRIVKVIIEKGFAASDNVLESVEANGQGNDMHWGKI